MGFSDGLRKLKQMKLGTFIMKVNVQSVFQSMFFSPIAYVVAIWP